MEYLANILTIYIFNKDLIDEKNIEIYRYGFQCFLEISLNIISCIIISCLFHMIPECIFFFFLFIPLRSYGGGFHMNSYLACFIGSCLILSFTLLAVKYFDLPFYTSFLLYTISTVLLIIIGPVDHPNREVDTEENHIFKKKALLTVFFSFLTASIFLFTNNRRYMFLQSIVFLFVLITSIMGRLVYKPPYSSS